MSQVKATEKNSCVVLEEKSGASKDKTGSCCMPSDSVESGARSVAGEEEEEAASGGEVLCKSLTASKYTRSKKGKRKSIEREESLSELIVVVDPARSKEEGNVVSVEGRVLPSCTSSAVDNKRAKSKSDKGKLYRLRLKAGMA